MFYDERIPQLAKTLVLYSTKVQPGDAVFIESFGFTPRPLVEAVAIAVAEAGGVPVVNYSQPSLHRKFLLGAKEETVKHMGEVMLEQMKCFQCYIALRGADNVYEMADVPKERLDWHNRYILQPVHLEQRCKHTRWCVLRYPNESMSQLAETSTESFVQFYYDVCCVDYPKMAEALKPLKAMMDDAKSFHLKGPGTDLHFDVTGIPAVPCAGKHNIPDGECFTAPVKDSVNGVVTFNTPSVHEGITYNGIRLEFKNGKVIDAQCGDNTTQLNEVLDVDDGARYVGEFSFGVNPKITKPMRDTLFDEKIGGSFHMALGACYDEAPNGNHSALHWDLVCIQREDTGGGEIECDGKLIRKDGRFIIPELEGLNPENL